VLDEETSLVRRCTDHPAEGEVQVRFYSSEEKLPDDVFCPGLGYCNETIETGVFLRHVGCEAVNPFWDSNNNTVTIPGRDSTTDYRLTTSGGAQNLKVTHWEIGMLRKMPATAKEMWFPLMLLRAMAEAHKWNRRRRIGVLVELAGAKSVGKTVLAMQAMEYEGYVPTSTTDERHIEVNGYIFSRRPVLQTALTDPFLGTLYLSNLMRLNQSGLYPIPPSDREPGNLKVAFIAPSAKSEEEADGNPRAPSQIERASSQSGFLSRMWQGVRELVQGGIQTFSSSGHHSFWYTVALYDVAGEAFTEGHSTPDTIESAADVVAILVDATELFSGSSSTLSIAVANDRIRKAQERRLRCCLVVTKLDAMMDRLTQDEQDKVQLIAEDLRTDRRNEARALLELWLNQRQADPNIKQLKNRLGNVEQVFFIWTENLPTSTAQGTVQTSTQQPHSYGLAKFICWCLNTSWYEINQK
jgi:hypothetical protein